MSSACMVEPYLLTLWLYDETIPNLIRSSVNRYGSTMHALDISDFGSLEVFYESIGFSAKDKEHTLERRVAKGRARSSYLNVPVIGSWVDGRAKELGIRRRQFPGITNFFRDGRGISRPVFSRVVRTFENELAK